MVNHKIFVGLIKWFDIDKKYGVIATVDSGDFFLHINNLESQTLSLSKGVAVVFEKHIDKSRNRNTAKRCREIHKQQDWELALSYIGKSDCIELEVANQGGIGGFYKKKELQSFSLIDLVTQQFFKNKDENEIVNIVTDYFDNSLKFKCFEEYCSCLENIIVRDFPKEVSDKILKDIFMHFGNNLNKEILFQVWRSKSFKFISYTEFEEYEIPEYVLNLYMSEINVPELKRISGFSFGTTFCSQFVKLKFNNIESLVSVELNDLYQLLEFVNNDEKNRLEESLNNAYVQQLTIELIVKAKELGEIKSNEDLGKYNQLVKFIPSTPDRNIETVINKIIISNCSEYFIPELWINGIIEVISFESVVKLFFDKETVGKKKVLILSKISLDQQFDLLKDYSNKVGFVKIFELLEELVKKENSFCCSFCLSKVIYESDFWCDKNCNELIHLFTAYVDDNCSDEEKYVLYFKGLVREIPLDILWQRINSINENECKEILENLRMNESLITEILQRKITANSTFQDYNWIYDLARMFLKDASFEKFDLNVFDVIDGVDYFKLWKNGKAKCFPKEFIFNYLNDDYDRYNQLDKWVDSKAILLERIIEFLYSYLSEQIQVENRLTFYKQLNSIKYLLQIDESYLCKIRHLRSAFYNLILWDLDKITDFDFDVLKGKFIYFTPSQQVRIIRKLFYLKETNQFDFEISKLNELVRIDLDLYNTSAILNPSISLDISTDLIIQVLTSYNTSKRFLPEKQFLAEKQLLSIVLKYSQYDKKRKFEFKNYFEACEGRELYEFNRSTNGEIRKITYGENQFYYAIVIKTSRHNNFELIKDAVKLLPNRKWNNENKYWEVPSEYETQILSFAKEYCFVFHFNDDHYYANNIHLTKFQRKGIPNGIVFCEGQLAVNHCDIIGKVFWWCANNKCYNKCETIHATEEWEKYTLLDFCKILKFDLDENNKYRPGAIFYGNYYIFVGLINRFNRLLDKLYCNNCHEILYPIETSNYAAYSVVNFRCENPACDHKDVIYLNHCLNKKCNEIIDSRELKKCSNGLYICKTCGSCCSHIMQSKRLESLISTGGVIHESLRVIVNKKLGHLERGEFFCYKCGNKMKEINPNIFFCPDCNVKYDRVKYTFNRSHNSSMKKKIDN